MSIMLSTTLAKILGIYFLSVGIAFFSNPLRFKKIYIQVMKDDNFLFYGALLALILGAIIVSIHNVWMCQWPVIITVLGWWSLIKGFALLVCPDCIHAFAFMQDRSHAFYRMLSLIFLALGAVLTVHGWMTLDG